VFHGKRHPLEMGQREVEAFSTHPATEEGAAGSIQNQAMSALLQGERQRSVGERIRRSASVSSRRSSVSIGPAEASFFRGALRYRSRNIQVRIDRRREGRDGPDGLSVEAGGRLARALPHQAITPGAHPRPVGPGFEPQEDDGVGRIDEGEEDPVDEAGLGVTVAVDRRGEQPELDPAGVRCGCPRRSRSDGPAPWPGRVEAPPSRPAPGRRGADAVAGRAAGTPRSLHRGVRPRPASARGR
jgi:hypothetical protein